MVCSDFVTPLNWRDTEAKNPEPLGRRVANADLSLAAPRCDLVSQSALCTDRSGHAPDLLISKASGVHF